MLKVIFYANASENIGAGHVMRLLAIAEAFSKHGEVDIGFLHKQMPEGLKKKIIDRKYRLAQAERKLNAAQINHLACDVLFIDDYELTTEEWGQIKTLTLLKVVMDDNIANTPLPVDVIVNAAPNVNETDYRSRNKNAILCLGPRYTQLRQEFNEQALIALNKRKNVLITLGGSDVKQLTLPLCRQMLNLLPDVPIIVIIGALNLKVNEQLQRLQANHTNLTIYHNANNMAELMANSAMAISAAGGSLGELASMGVPTIALVCVDNQVAALNADLVGNWYEVFDLRSLDSENTEADVSQVCYRAVGLWHDSSRRLSMNEKASQVVDAQGCERIVETVLNTREQVVQVEK